MKPKHEAFAVTREEIDYLVKTLESRTQKFASRDGLLNERILARLVAFREVLYTEATRGPAPTITPATLRPRRGNDVPAVDEWGELASQIGERVVLERVERNLCPRHGVRLSREVGVNAPHAASPETLLDRWHCPETPCGYTREISK